MNILSIGHVCIDTNNTEHAQFTAAGGPAMFMDRIFRQLPGCSVTVVSPYGKDFFLYKGQTRLFPESPTADRTMVYENTVRNGIRTQRCLFHLEADPPEMGDDVTDSVRSADCICIAPLTPGYSVRYLSRLLTQKKPEAFVVLLPQGYFRSFDETGAVEVREFSEAPSILPLIDTVIVSDQDHADMSALMEHWVRRYGVTGIVTLADRGATVISTDKTIHVPTEPVPPGEIVSSVGAGDIFSAGYIYEFHRTRDPVRAAAFGNALARQCLFYTPDSLQIRIG